MPELPLSPEDESGKLSLQCMWLSHAHLAGEILGIESPGARTVARREFKDLAEVKRVLDEYADSSPETADALTLLVDATLKMAQEMSECHQRMADCQQRMADCQQRMADCEQQMADCQTRMAECEKRTGK